MVLQEEISMDWLAKYWWILVIVFLVGVLLNVIKDLKRVDHKKFLANKPELPPHRDFNVLEILKGITRYLNKKTQVCCHKL